MSGSDAGGIQLTAISSRFEVFEGQERGGWGSSMQFFFFPRC